jgi:hypothetical protein
MTAHVQEMNLMSDNSSKSIVEGLIATRGPQERARIEPVSVEIRSSERFIISDPLRGVRGQPPQYVVQERLQSGEVYIGGIVVEWGFDIRAGREDAFHRWLLDNEQDLYSARPDNGVRYKGTYAVHSASDPDAGSYRTIWAFDSFSNFDDFGAAMAKRYPHQEPITAFGDLLREYFSFWDNDSKAYHSQQTLVLAVSTNPTRRFRKE